MSRAELSQAGRQQWEEKRARRAKIYRRRRALALLLVVTVLLMVGYMLPRAFGWVSDQISGDSLGGEEPLAEVRGDQIPTSEEQIPERAPESPEPEPTPERASDPSWDPDSIHVLVNRQNPLEPADHAPEDLVAPGVRMSTQTQLLLREEAASALEELIVSAGEEGQVLAMTSGYRSYEAQRSLYAGRHSAVGTEQTDELVARPGYSEHQTGLAVDVISIENPRCIRGECFGDTSEGRWVAEHAADHGFVIRYPNGAEEITGYAYEPWHLRYVGVETAQEVETSGLTLEEYWEQPPAAEYDVEEPDPQVLGGP